MHLPANAGDIALIPWVGNILWSRKWQPTPVFLTGKSHGQRSLAGCSPWGHKRIGHDECLKYTHTILLYTFQTWFFIVLILDILVIGYSIPIQITFIS